MKTTASIGGRQLTLDPLTETPPVIMQPARVENSIPAGFRVEWLSGEQNDPDAPFESFTLTSGAGCGSPYMVLSVKMRDGSTREEVVNMVDVVPGWINQIVDAGPTPKVEDES